MNESAGHHPFVKASSAQLVEHFNQSSADLTTAIKLGAGLQTDAEVEAHRLQLLADFTSVRDAAAAEIPEPYIHYASRVDIVGLYQSILGTVFEDVPGLQGYGDKNAVWVITPLEELGFKLKSFFHEVHELEGVKMPLLQAVIKAWKDIKVSKATYPPGTPAFLPLDERSTVSLLADWGGDNPAARQVATTAANADPKPRTVIHLGDIYYGGIKAECEAFLRNWPLQIDPAENGVSKPQGTSLALNGNHEMYSGGESFFKVVLPAFGQKQPFFCLEGEYWRLIGLDTAYLEGRLKPNSVDDPMQVQWQWLIDLLSKGPKRANIFLSHHQPVSAHAQEFSDSEPLRGDICELLATAGIKRDAIFAWFFGHEHRFTIYRDDDTLFNARLIGSGCIPHEVQHEVKADPGCTPFAFVCNRGVDGSQTAISQYAELQFLEHQLRVVYMDQKGTSLGWEMWDATKSRLDPPHSLEHNGTTFTAAD